MSHQNTGSQKLLKTETNADNSTINFHHKLALHRTALMFYEKILVAITLIPLKLLRDRGVRYALCVTGQSRGSQKTEKEKIGGMKFINFAETGGGICNINHRLRGWTPLLRDSLSIVLYL